MNEFIPSFRVRRRGGPASVNGPAAARARAAVLVGCAVIAAAACAPKQIRVEAPELPEPSAPATPSAPAVAPLDESGHQHAVPPALQRFSASVQALDASSPDLDHQPLIDALRAASGALEAISSSPGVDAQGPRRAAERIEASGPESSHHADAVVAGLSAAQRQLRTVEARSGREHEYAAALERLEQGLGKLSPARPLLEQRTAVVDAFDALEEAVFVAAGQEAPSARPGGAAAARSADSRLNDARDRVAELARADLTNVREHVASALSSLADLVDAVGADGGQKQTGEMRFQAERLRRAQSSSFAQTDWVERGLVSALDVLDAWQPCRSEVVKDWSATARAGRGRP